MRIEIEKVLRAEWSEPAWQFYLDAFEELRGVAVQRHIMHRHGFDEVRADHRVLNVAGLDEDGQMAALATITDDLDAVPLIEPAYFQQRWPRHVAERRVFYVGFLAVHPRRRGTGFFDRIVGEVHRMVRAADGLLAVDICQRNEDVFALPDSIRDALATFAGDVRSRRLDAQSYWLYEFPAAS